MIRALTSHGLELFIAGDDDQSIYGFRQAHPQGIRDFPQEYPNSVDLPLQTCMRCDPNILSAAEFVAAQDPQRLPRITVPYEGRIGGEVALLRFDDQFHEADSIATLCGQIIDIESFLPEEILILLRVDTRNAFSLVIKASFDAANIPISVDAASNNPLDSSPGRQVLAFLRLLRNSTDHLAWRTLLQLRRNGIGAQRISSIYQFARARGLPFHVVLEQLAVNPILLPRIGSYVEREFSSIMGMISDLQSLIEPDTRDATAIEGILTQIIDTILPCRDLGLDALDYLTQLACEVEASSLSDILVAVEASSVAIEPEIIPGAVNVLTMHKAKGLSARAVIVLAVEDEHIPGRQVLQPHLGDERRLLFVSMSRARNILILTYCDHRVGQQRMLGRNPGNPSRSLTQFLRHGPLRPQEGEQYIFSRSV
jgi:DNA helicase-2/ATP-dependent DNA helicase PcrA